MVVGGIQLRRPPIPVTPISTTLTIHCSLTKQGQRFLTSLTATAGDDSATTRLIRKFTSSSPKSISLTTLSHLLLPNSPHSHLTPLSLLFYSTISQQPWFSWNPKLVAQLIGVLYKHQQFDESETLVSETVLKLGSREREITQFYCNLIDSHSKHGSKRGVFHAYERLNRILSSSSSSYLKRKCYESMINGLCVLDMPSEGEEFVEEMIKLGLKLSVFELRNLVHAYGRLGLFEDMQRIVAQMVELGFGIDTICSNMVLSSYGAFNAVSEMVLWIRKMKELGIELSIRTYNSVLNSCPKMMLIVQNDDDLPLSISELKETLGSKDCSEALLVEELIDSTVLMEIMEWNSSELKLDLHGMHLGSAYLIMLQWIDEVRRRLMTGDCGIPTEVTVVCGLGKHSIVRGESPVKGLVKKMMVKMKSPMRIDRKNVGCFIAKGKVVKDWLC